MQKTLSVANIVKPSIQKLDNLPSPDKPSKLDNAHQDRRMGNKALSTSELRHLSSTNRIPNVNDRNTKAQSQDANELLAHFLKQTSHDMTEKAKRKSQNPYTDHQMSQLNNNMLSGQDYGALGKSQQLTRNMTSSQALSNLSAN